MASYTDTYNNGNPNSFTDVNGGATFYLGAGWDKIVGSSHEIVLIGPGASDDVLDPNTFSFTGDYNTINLNGTNTWLWVSTIQASGTHNTINGTASNNNIYAYVGTSSSGKGANLNFSGFTLNGISAIYGTNYNDSITGSG